jgi:MSHA biogenesis protein MshI
MQKAQSLFPAPIATLQNALGKLHAAPNQLGIEITPKVITVAQINNTQPGQTILEYTQSFYGSDFSERQHAFNEFMSDKKNKKNQINLVLHPAYYRLLLVDAPNVPDEELRDAMLWRVKDLISEPIDKVVLDIIRLPKDAYEGRMNMLYVAVAPRLHLDLFIEMLLSQDLRPNWIDISELSLRNIVIKLAGNRSCAVVCIKDQGSFVSVITQQQLYLTRNIDVNIETLHEIANSSESHVEQLVMDVQRSLDYYESQLGKGSIEQLMFCPATSRGVEKSISYLAKNLSCPVILMDILQLIKAENELSLPEQAQALSAIGAAMRAT